MKQTLLSAFAFLLVAQSCLADPTQYFINHGGLTSVEFSQAKDLFLQTTTNSEMRMPSPNAPDGGGKCWQRANSIEDWLKSQNIQSGKMDVFCSGRNIKATDQVSKKVFYYSDYHEVPILLVKDNETENLYVIDPQFEIQPVELHAYLKKIIVNNTYKAFMKEDMGMPNKGEPCKWYLYSSATNLNTAEMIENQQ